MDPLASFSCFTSRLLNAYMQSCVQSHAHNHQQAHGKNQEASIEAPLCHWGDFYRISEKRQKGGKYAKARICSLSPYPSVFLLPSIFFSICASHLSGKARRRSRGSLSLGHVSTACCKPKKPLTCPLSAAQGV